MNRALAAVRLLRYLGPGWAWARTREVLEARLGWLERRLPRGSWAVRPLHAGAEARAAIESRAREWRTCGARFFFSGGDAARYRPLLAGFDGGTAGGSVARAEALAGGVFRYFEHHDLEVGFPPDWFRSPFTGERWSGTTHWSRIGDFAGGDIKGVWEASRFGGAFLLVRAYWRSGREEFAELFWRLVEDWRERNPPNTGPNWRCGQESSLRAMAWLFGLHGMGEARATTAGRVAALLEMLAATGHRVEGHLWYALSQHNNHAISEGVALFTLGLLFPQWPEAGRWERTGRDVLEACARELVYDDGAFAQHSFNYQRLMLQAYVWALRLAALNGRPLSGEVLSRVGASSSLLARVMWGSQGQAPNHGHHDGALILPLNNCDSTDFRPVVQAGSVATRGCRAVGAGAWDEDLLWLFGPDALSAPVETVAREDGVARDGGYVILHGRESAVFVHCPRFRHRPGQADLLHLDLWWRGANVALDAGTYSYNAPPPWDNGLAHSDCHNTVTVDGEDQMDRLTRFLWLPWARGTSGEVRRSADGRVTVWEGAHDGYRRLADPVRHRRALVRLGDHAWLVLDGLDGGSRHRFRLHWLLADAPHSWEAPAGRLQLRLPVGELWIALGAREADVECSLRRADSESHQGWHSPYYLARQPALSLAGVVEGEAAMYGTVFSPAPVRVAAARHEVRVVGADWTSSVALSGAARTAWVGRVRHEAAVGRSEVAAA